MSYKIVIRLFGTILLVYIILLSIFSKFGSFYSKPLLPLFQWEIELFVPELDSTHVALEDYQGKQIIAVNAETSKHIKTTDRIFMVDCNLDCKIPVMNQYLHPIIIFSILIAWPKIPLQERFKILTIALPLLLLVEMIDIPLVVVSQFQEKLNSISYGVSSDPQMLPSYWANLLNVGGRYILCIVSACLAVACFRFHQVWKMEIPERNDPCPCGSGRKYKRCCLSG